jgi:hypothetical protein
MSKTFTETLSSIAHGSFTNEQLRELAEAIKYRRAQIVRDTKRQLALGDVVEFVNPRTGRRHRGNVVKIAIKNIKVREGLTTWNVPAHMLTIV